MGSVVTAAVTPEGVRDGDPLALSGLVERRGAAVLAYARHVAPGDVLGAAGDALGRFRAAVVAADDPSAIHPERQMLRAARLASAQRAPRGANGARHARRNHACTLVPELLAARAEGTLSGVDAQRLARHLERCGPCREAQGRFDAAERAYRDAPDDPPTAPAATELMRALFAAAPVVRDEGPAANGHATNGHAANGHAVNGHGPGPTPDPVGPVPEAPIEAEERPIVMEPELEANTSVLPSLTTFDTADFEDLVDEDEPPTAGAIALPDGRGGGHGLLLSVLVPAMVVLAGLIVALAVAGVFSGRSAPAEQASDVAPPVTAPAAAPATVPRAKVKAKATPKAKAKAKSKSKAKADAKARGDGPKKRVQDEPTSVTIPTATTPGSPTPAPRSPPRAAPTQVTRRPAPVPVVPRPVTRPTTTQAAKPAPQQTVRAGSPTAKAPPANPAPATPGAGFTPSG